MKFVYQVIIVVVIAGISAFGISYFLTPKIAYVRIGEVVNKYEGMMEAKSAYKDKIANWQANVDTLELDYQKMVSQYNLESSKLSPAQRQDQVASLQKQKENIQQYIGTLEQKAQEEDAKMTKAVINQINSAIEEYAKSKGYDYVLGTTNEGNILYGVKSKDITQTVLDYVNEKYKQK